MSDVKGTANAIPEETQDNRNESAEPDKKMTELDKMIEEFKLANPVKNKRRMYKGVF
jgi:hypothetical protein